MNLDQKSSLKACLEEEKDNPRMKDYVKILDTPNISAFEWIHRVQEELMDGIVYLEKLREILKMNMRELDAARLAAMKETENKVTSTQEEDGDGEEDKDEKKEVREDEETIEININVPGPEEKDPTMFSTKTPEVSDNKPKKKKIKVTKPKTTS
tara:strand:- start:11152 stop:11613 length:462 start_codon:yes stop_codon:yes gene_type:complete